jgi:hypothetical protein
MPPASIGRRAIPDLVMDSSCDSHHYRVRRRFEPNQPEFLVGGHVRRDGLDAECRDRRRRLESTERDCHLSPDEQSVSRNRLGRFIERSFSFAFAKFNENGADLTTGTYAVGPTNTNANFVLVGGTGTWSAIPGVTGSPVQGSGSVVLTAFSKTSKSASGTFSFVLAGGNSTKTVTNRIFNVTFK